MPDLHAIAQELQDQEERVRLEHEQLVADITAVMALAAGRRTVWRWLSLGRVFQPCFTGNSKSFYNEGRREFALQIFTEVLEACPGLYAQAVQEMQARKERDA